MILKLTFPFVCLLKSFTFTGNYLCMKKGFTGILLFGFSKALMAQNEVGPDGDKLIWLILFFIIPILFFSYKFFRKNSGKKKKPFVAFSKIELSLSKDKKYYPGILTLTVKNSGSKDLDLDKPMLVFSNFWLNRKFRLKGSENRTFYPLYLEAGKTHELDIDLNKFYKHDKSLKKFPKASIKIMDVKGKKLGSKHIYLRKTLLNS